MCKRRKAQFSFFFFFFESSVFMKRNIRRKRLVPFLSQKHHLAPLTIILRKLYPGDLGGVQFEDRPIITQNILY